jgi:hypothetical protein
MVAEQKTTPAGHHENTKGRSHERITFFSFFVFSNFDELVKSRVHPSIPQGERFEATVSVRFSVRGEVSNHERKGVRGLFTNASILTAS